MSYCGIFLSSSEASRQSKTALQSHNLHSYSSASTWFWNAHVSFIGHIIGSGMAHHPLKNQTNRCSMHIYASFSHPPYSLPHIPLHIVHSTYCVPTNITTWHCYLHNYVHVHCMHCYQGTIMYITFNIITQLTQCFHTMFFVVFTHNKKLDIVVCELV